MKPKLLQKLIKKVQKEIDQSRLEKVQAQLKIDSLNLRLQELRDELLKEQELASESIEYRMTYQNYYISNKARQHNVKLEIKRVETLILEIEDRIFEEFRSMKQYEILLNRYHQAKKDRIENEESKSLDEIGIRRAG